MPDSPGSRAIGFGTPGAPWSWRVDGAWAAVLALGVFLTRWPIRATTLTTVDSILFALAADRYDVYELRPHAPGYPVFVALVKLGRLFVDDHNAVMVFWSITFSAAAVVLLYGLARRIASRRAALGAAALFALAPVFVFNGVIATTYAGEALGSIGIAWSAWEAWQRPTLRRVALVAGVFALTLGLRPSILFYFAPLTAFIVFAPKPRDIPTLARRLGAAAAAAVPVGLAWLLPMVWASGGWTRYRTATSLQSSHVVFADAVWVRGWDGFSEHVWRLGFFLRFEMVLLPILAVALLVLTWSRYRGIPLRESFAAPRGLALFLALWLGPALLFYALVFDGFNRGPLGYILVVLPGVYLVFALIVDAALRALTPLAVAGMQRIKRTSLPAAPFAAVAGVALLLLPAPTLAAGWDSIIGPEVRAHDEWTGQWLSMRDEFPPNETAIVAYLSWAHVKWYHPEYVTWSPLDIRPGRGEGDPWIRMLETQGREDDLAYYAAYEPDAVIPNHTIPDDIRRVVVFDFQIAGERGHPRLLIDEVQVNETYLPNGWRVVWFPVDPERRVIEEYFIPPL